MSARSAARRQGAGRAGDRALAWLGKYTRNGTVFLTDLGGPYTRVQLTALVRAYDRKSKIGRIGGGDLFRRR